LHIPQFKIMYNITTNRLLTAMAVMGMLLGACRKMNFNSNDLRNFEQIDLVANRNGYGAALIDPTLQNAWGLAWSPSGIAWVNANADGLSELYNNVPAIVRPPVLIPSPTDTMGGAPSGIVFNSTKGFILPDKSAAAFIFVGEDGVVSAWNGGAGNKAFRVAADTTNEYKGLALAWDNGRNLLYAANFKTGAVDVWDTSWMPVKLPFHDPAMPAGYAPFNIVPVSSWLFVSYAKVSPDFDDVAGPGNGFVDVFTTDGAFVRRFASRGALNAPWGMAWAPAGWLTTQDMDSTEEKGNSQNNGKTVGPVVLVGNFGDGRINVYSPEGQFLGPLRAHNQAISIDGLWAIGFPPSTATSIDQARLYFTAGPAKETDGIFGYIVKE
jgi:uncharacterized protein (TIGR03118 family)